MKRAGARFSWPLYCHVAFFLCFAGANLLLHPVTAVEVPSRYCNCLLYVVLLFFVGVVKHSRGQTGDNQGSRRDATQRQSSVSAKFT